MSIKLYARGSHQDVESLMLFVDYDELALRIRSSFLPGQRGELQERERRAFVKGILATFNRQE